ncbi:MAG: hypothetical protein ACLFN8_01380 [Candidatus Woesearchaeota archaeon]
MKRKGQAAMEFLMTYGWAILVVLAAIAALAYFGVLSPGNMLPERTTFAAPIQSIDSVVSASTPAVEIVFRNNVGTKINISTNDMAGTEDCDSIYNAYITGDDVTASGNGYEIPNGAQFTLAYNCSSSGSGLSAGNRFRSDLTFQYTNMDTELTRPHTGSINAKVNP